MDFLSLEDVLFFYAVCTDSYVKRKEFCKRINYCFCAKSRLFSELQPFSLFFISSFSKKPPYQIGISTIRVEKTKNPPKAKLDLSAFALFINKTQNEAKGQNNALRDSCTNGNGST